MTADEAYQVVATELASEDVKHGLTRATRTGQITIHWAAGPGEFEPGTTWRAREFRPRRRTRSHENGWVW
jgi:hypothetical protein